MRRPKFGWIYLLTAWLLAATVLPVLGQHKTPSRPDSSIFSQPQQEDLRSLSAANSAAATVQRDVIYGFAGGVLLKMDLYLPANSNARSAPAAIHLHGGAWLTGDKASGPGIDDIPELLARGYVVASINYRLAPLHPFPAQIEDAKCAVRFLRANAARFGIDPLHIVAWGSSAGGHLAALLALTDSKAGFDGRGGWADQSSQVQAAATLFGPSDLTTSEWSFLDRLGFLLVFGTPGNWAKASPINYVTKGDAPLLIISGEKDNLVSPKQAQLLFDRLKAAQVPTKLIVVKNSGHDYAPVGGALNPSRAEMSRALADFFDQYARQTASAAAAGQ